MRYKTKQRMLQVLVKLLPVSKRKPQKGKRSFCASISIPKWSGGLGRRSLGSGANNFTHDSSSRVAAAPKTGDLEHKRGVLPSSVNELSPHTESRTICIYHECGLLSSHAPIRTNFGLIFPRTYHLKISIIEVLLHTFEKNILEANICLKEKQDQNMNLGVLLGLQRGDRPQLLSKESRLGAAQIPPTSVVRPKVWRLASRSAPEHHLGS